MGRTVYAEERCLNYLSSLSKKEGYTIGLILGQSTGQKDFVVHLAKTPPAAPKNVVEETLITSTTNVHEKSNEKCIKSVKEIPENWVADHVTHVTRMLPGGMYVRGIFLVGSEDVFTNRSDMDKLKSILSVVNKTLSSYKFLHGKSDPENLILNYNSNTQKYTGKSVDIQKDDILRPVDWKFQSKPTMWHQLETRVDLDQIYNILQNKDYEPFKHHLQDILENISDMIETTLVLIENETLSSEDLVEGIRNKNRNKAEYKNREAEDKPLQVTLYIPCSADPDLRLKILRHPTSMHLVGQLVSRTFVHQKATVGEAINAIKEDIMRSLTSRFEMHCESLIEEEGGSPEEKITLHEFPTRVLVSLPQSKITVSDYLFPGEGPQEALVSLQELLDLEVQESDVEKDLEVQVDPSEYYGTEEIDTVPNENGKDSTGSNQFAIYYIGLIVALLILIVAFLLQQFNE